MKLVKGTTAKNYLLIAGLVLLVYFPLTFGLFSLKNDALSPFLAYRYHTSEAIQNGYFPFWSPYLYTGLPLHADMQGMVWNPVVLLLSLVGRYNMTLLQWEVLIYFVFAGIGAYRLIRFLGLSERTALCCAAAYVSSGFMTDSVSVIPWIGSAAFLPFAIHYFLQCLQMPALRNAARFSLALSLVFLCGYPSLFIFLNYLFFFGFLAWLTMKWEEEKKLVWKSVLCLAVAYLAFGLLCSPALISYYEFLPYYSRGIGINYNQASTNPFPIQSVLSWVVPTAVSKYPALQTDIVMRNGYFGLLLFLFFCAGLARLNRLKIMLLCFTLFCFLFSLGAATPVHQFCYQMLPLFRTFRHPGVMRVFTSLGLIVMAAYALEECWQGKQQRLFQRIVMIALGILLMTAFLLLATGSLTGLTSLKSLQASAIKAWIDTISFEQLSFFVLTLQIIFLTLFLLLAKRRVHQRMLPTILIANSVLFAWAALPLTAVSQYRVAAVNSFVASFPDGYPANIMNAPAETGSPSSPFSITVHGYTKFYDKTITVQDHLVTPTITRDYEAYLENSKFREKLKGYPLAYVLDESNGQRVDTVQLMHISPNRFVFDVHIKNPGRLHLFQQFHHSWQATVNGKKAEVAKDQIAFMSIAVPAGRSQVVWQYDPVHVKYAMVLAAITLCCLLYFVFQKKRSLR
jgi:hypothetical protein